MILHRSVTLRSWIWNANFYVRIISSSIIIIIFSNRSSVPSWKRYSSYSRVPYLLGRFVVLVFGAGCRAPIKRICRPLSNCTAGYRMQIIAVRQLFVIHKIIIISSRVSFFLFASFFSSLMIRDIIAAAKSWLAQNKHDIMNAHQLD